MPKNALNLKGTRGECLCGNPEIQSLHLSFKIMVLETFEGVLHLLPQKSQISMFCALSQNYQHLFEK